MLGEADYDLTALAMQQGNQKQSEEDARLLVVFTSRPHHNVAKSAEAGRPIFEDRDFVTIMVPGDKDSVIERVATDIDKRRFRAQYTAYKQNQAQETVTGTPLRAATFLTAAQIKELEYFNVHTVEQLADMNDGNVQKFMMGHKMKQLAKDYLAAAKDSSAITSMREQLEARDAQIAAQDQALKEQGERIAALEKMLAPKKAE